MQQPQADDWVELPRQIYLTTLCHCDCCGQMVARRYLRREHEGKELRFCSAACATLWREYWLPRYGLSTASPPAVAGT
ncbi:MAG: hypothetical protein ACREFU_11625 [Acetobacteraceae bacterium]